MMRRFCLSLVLLNLVVIVPLRAEDYFRPHDADTHVDYAASRADYRLSLAEAAATSSRSSLDASRQRVYDLGAAIGSQQRILDQLYIDIERGEANLESLADELQAGEFADAATQDVIHAAQRDVDDARKAADEAWAASEQEFRSSLAYATLAEKLGRSAEAIERSPFSILHRQLHEQIVKLQQQVDSLKESGDAPALAAAEVELSEKLRALAAFESILPWVSPGMVAALREYDEAHIAMTQLVENFEKLRPENPNILAAEEKLREAEARLSATLAAMDLPSRGDLAAGYNNQINWLNARRRDADRAEANLNSFIYQLEHARTQMTCAERDFRSRLAFVSSAHYCRNVAYARLHHHDYDDHDHRRHLHERRQQWLTNRPGGGEPVKGPFAGPLTEKEYRERDKRRGDDDDRRDFDRAQHSGFRDDDRNRDRDDDRSGGTPTLLVPAGEQPVVDMKRQPTAPTRQDVEKRDQHRVIEIKPRPTVPTRLQVERPNVREQENQGTESQQNKPSLQESARRAEEQRQEARKDEAQRRERARVADQERAAAEAERRQRLESGRQTREARHDEEQARKEQNRQEQQERAARQQAREAEAAARAEAKAREQQEQQEEARKKESDPQERQRNSDSDRSKRNNDGNGRSGRSRK